MNRLIYIDGWIAHIDEKMERQIKKILIDLQIDRSIDILIDREIDKQIYNLNIGI